MGVDTARNALTQWAVGANWTRMSAGNSEVAGLAGQQVGHEIIDGVVEVAWVQGLLVEGLLPTSTSLLEVTALWLLTSMCQGHMSV